MDADLLLKALIAMAPVLVLLLVFDRLDVFNLINFRTIALLVLTGGAVAGASYLVNWRVLDGFPIGFSAYSRYVAPVIEETLKAAPILWLFATNRLGFKLDAAIAAFAVGAGFSVVENGWYLSAGFASANLSAWLVRGFGTAIMHGGATALFAVIGHEMSERQLAKAAPSGFNPLLFLPGLAAAMVVHSVFNHFPDQPLMIMALTLMLVPAVLFLIFFRSERATQQWLAADAEAHRKALAEMRDGRFRESEAGRAIGAKLSALKGANAQDVFAYVELKLALVLRAEELLLAVQIGEAAGPSAEDRAQMARLETLERTLGRSVLAALAPHLGFSRNDLWELERLKARVRESVAQTGSGSP